jgi:hypothetical protein
MWNGITTLELAKQIDKILTITPKLSGIVNLVPRDMASKWGLIKFIVEEWKLPLKVKEICDKPYSYKILRTARPDSPVITTNYYYQFKELHEYMDKHNIKVGDVK